MRTGSDVWICGRCRSVNPPSRSRCDKCSTPMEVAAARPEDLTKAPSRKRHEALQLPGATAAGASSTPGTAS